jgi:hypothetical protein
MEPNGPDNWVFSLQNITVSPKIHWCCGVLNALQLKFLLPADIFEVCLNINYWNILSTLKFDQLTFSPAILINIQLQTLGLLLPILYSHLFNAQSTLIPS